MKAASFFATLPAGRLNPIETELRDLLHRTAGLSSTLLPKGVALQDWVDRRMPGELVFAADKSSGKMCLETLPEGSAKAAPRDPPGRAATQSSSSGSVPGNTGNPVLKDQWFKKLPGDAFSAKEEALREVLMSTLKSGPKVITTMDQRVSTAARAFLPPYVTLAEWIERRIGAEVSLYKDAASGQQTCRLGLDGEVPAADPKEEFFNSLPGDSYTPEEERLRDSLFDFLANWQSQELATLTQLGSDKEVHQARTALFPKGVSIREWMEKRMGEELELRKDAKGQFVVHITTKAHPLVRARYETKSKEPPKPERPERPERPAREPTITDFFKRLPDSELTNDELALREALLGTLERRGTASVILAEVNTDKGVRDAKVRLLPKHVALKDWIDRRIGMEVETKSLSNGQVSMALRSAKAEAEAKAKAKLVERVEKPAAPRPQDKEKDTEQQRLARERFFAGLPGDEFGQAEMDLRESLLAYIDQWPGPESPELSKAGNDPIVRNYKIALIPKGSGVTLQDWIDRRIGAEVETNAAGGLSYFGLRGTLVLPGGADARKRKGTGQDPPVKLRRGA